MLERRFPESSIRNPQSDATYIVPDASLLGHFVPDFPREIAETQREVSPLPQAPTLEPAMPVFNSELVPGKPDVTPFDSHPATDENLPLTKPVLDTANQIRTTRPFSLPQKRSRGGKFFNTA